MKFDLNNNRKSNMNKKTSPFVKIDNESSREVKEAHSQ